MVRPVDWESMSVTVTASGTWSVNCTVAAPFTISTTPGLIAEPVRPSDTSRSSRATLLNESRALMVTVTGDPTSRLVGVADTSR